MIETGHELLIDMARQAALNAHVPHSGFRVGAALLSTDGSVTLGCNVEGDSFGLTCCAERVAMFAAVAAGRRTFTTLAVTCLDGDASGDPGSVMPCGACRQMMVELCGDAEIVVDGVGVFSTRDLLPEPFTLRGGTTGDAD